MSELPDSINVAIVDLIDTCFSVCHGVVGWKTKDLNEAKAKLEREITAWNIRAYEPDQARIAELKAEVERLRALLSAASSSADRNCPCHEETPDPCPKCGASVENLEACRAGELTLPVGVYGQIRAALEKRHDP